MLIIFHQHFVSFDNAIFFLIVPVWLISLCLSTAVGSNQKWFWYGLLLVYLFYVNIWPWWGKWISSHSSVQSRFCFVLFFEPERPMVGNDRCNPKSSHLILLLTSFTLNFSVFFLFSYVIFFRPPCCERYSLKRIGF